ncbi:MAG TPA: transcription termination/antitermination NusG family protein [Planctomycetota bacterium]|nr:transcription termination/antitermination NusG family protein [Planctomycetota bacterium]
MDLASSTVESVLPQRDWAVAWTKARCEKSLAEYLAVRDVPHFLPLYAHRRVYGKSIQTSRLPLFPGYVFFDASAIQQSDVYASRKVAQVLRPGQPDLLARELSNLSLALSQDESLREARFGQPGRPVYVARGPLKGVYGEFVRYGSDARLIIKVEFISRAAELAIDEAFIEPLH